MIEGFPLTQLQLYVFLYALEGKCKFDGGEWKCGGSEFPYARKVLTSMGIPPTDQEKVLEMIKYAETLGVDTINFHALFKHGFPLDTWTEETDISWKNWMDVYSVINKSVKNDEYDINVRLPQHFVSPEEFQKKPKYYGYCPVKLRDRILVHPDGILRICSGLLGSQYGIGRYYGDKITWDKSGTNETNDHKFEEDTACTNQSRNGLWWNASALFFL